jgi:hypothetical protein
VARKPVDPKRKPTPAARAEKPLIAAKQIARQRLVGKGVALALAKWLSGEDENLTRQQIAQRRIEWQRTLQRKK